MSPARPAKAAKAKVERKPERLFEAKVNALPAAIRADVQQALRTPVPRRNEIQKYLAAKFEKRLAGMTFPGNGWRLAVLEATSSAVVVGSKMVRKPPLRFRDFEKSPVRSRSVGTVRRVSRGSLVRQPS